MLKRWLTRRSRQANALYADRQNGDVCPAHDSQLPLDFEQTIGAIRSSFGNSADLQVHRFTVFQGKTDCAIVFLKSFTDVERLNESILVSMYRLNVQPKDIPQLARLLPCAGSREAAHLGEIYRALASGEAVLLLSGFKSALILPMQRHNQRTTEEPQNEHVIRGPRDGFVEALWSNIGMLRQRIKNPDFRLEVMLLGSRTSVEVGIVYVAGLASSRIVEEVRCRLRRIDVDRLLSTGAISEFIADSPWSPFPTFQFTERPDRLASALLDGRVGIFVDGEPSAAVVPTVFWEFLKSSDDYTENVYFISFIRFVRFVAHLITLLLPGAYVALTTIHVEMLPQSLAVIIAGARTRTPFPVAVEMLAMELMVEVLREGGLRMPGVLGPTMSIVGALVIGDAAVTAGLVEPIIVVIVAFTNLTAFIVPGYNAAISIRMLRFPLIVLGATLGFFGLALGAMFYLMHLVSLRSFGVPYFAPLGPLFLQDLKDLMVRLPWWQQSHRPSFYRGEDRLRQDRGQKPGPGKGG